MDITNSIVPPPPEPSPVRAASHRLVRIWIVVGATIVLLASLLFAASVVQVPYFLISPGSVRATEPLIVVEGATTYDNPGEVNYTTVSLKHSSALEAAMGWLDPTVDVVDEDDILGGRSQDENRQANLQEMTDSKQIATTVALETLGYEVISHGTGAAVRNVVPDTPAATVLHPGDVVIEADGQPVELSQDLVAIIQARAPGDTMSLRYEPGDGAEAVDASVVLIGRPDDAENALLGVETFTRDLRFEYPFEVSIDSGSVGGPSAGLAFTLGLIDLLSPQSLTGGMSVATTGTIQLDGRVGPIGGIEQKAVAVRRSGADLFLVPSSELEQARRFSGDLRVEPVDTIDDALAVLATLGGGTDVLAQATPEPAGN